MKRDCDRHGGWPARRCLRGVSEYPFAELIDHTGLLSDRNKLVWRQQALSGVTPSNESLSAREFPECIGTMHALEEDFQLARVNRARIGHHAGRARIAFQHDAKITFEAFPRIEPVVQGGAIFNRAPIAGTSPDDLKSVRLGVTAATSQESYAKKLYSGVATTVVHASPDLYKELADGNVDIILEDKLAVYDWLANTKAGGCCEFKGADIKNTEYFGDGAGIAVRPSDKELLAKLNTALQAIQADDTYDTINAKYFPFSIR